MDVFEKTRELKSIIEETLVGEITNDYIFLDLPYYTNLGDTLIWEGTKQFLEKLPYKCLYSTDMNFFVERKLSPDTIILLQGGGNFGDIYREHTCFRKKIIQLYPMNKVIILPQSVYYINDENLKEDMVFYSQYKNVTICTREEYSYNFVKSKFVNNRVLLVPDLAFYISLEKYKVPISLGKILFLKRRDSELVIDVDYSKVPKDAEICDWPTFEDDGLRLNAVYYIFRGIKLLASIGGKKWKNHIEDFKRNSFYRKKYVQIGIDFLSRYDDIYTTRLHVLILAVLLGKNVYIYNNETGKLKNFYNSWLSDLNNVNLVNA